MRPMEAYKCSFGRTEERPMRILLPCIAALAVTLSTPAFGAITVGSGSMVNFADAAINLGCSDLTIAGQASSMVATLSAIANLSVTSGGVFAPGGSQITLGGNFSDAGTFTPGASRVSIVDDCGSGKSQISGTTSFYDFVVASTVGKQLVFPAGLTQGVSHALTLQGVAGNLLQILSSTAGTRAILAVSAGTAQTVSYVNARDNNASAATIAPGAASLYNSVDSGNLLNWFANATTTGPVPAPALGGGRWLLM